MSLSTDYDATSRIVRVSISDNFDLSVHKEFGEIIKAAKNRRDSSYVIDMREVKYMDSSALGMLLLLRDSVGRNMSNIDIIRCQSSVKDIFAIANFSKLFNIS